MASVFRAQGSPSPTKMSNTLLPMEFDTAMSPIPARRQRLGQETESRDRRRQVGGEVGSILIQRGTKTADGAFSIFDDKPKNKRRWEEEDTAGLMPLTKATTSPQGRLLFTPPTGHLLPSFISSFLWFCGYSPASLPWRATIRLAMQSGTLVPAARKVMPMMTSGIPSVKPITVTWNGQRRAKVCRLFPLSNTLFYCSLPPGDTHNDVPASLLMLHSDERVSEHLACFCQGVKCSYRFANCQLNSSL